MASPQETRPPTERRQVLSSLFTALALVTVLPFASSSPSWSSPSLSVARSWGRLPSVANNFLSRKNQLNQPCRQENCYDRNYALDESDFDDYEDSDYDRSDDQYDESILWTANSFRGGGATIGGGKARVNLPGLHTGWRKKNSQNRLRQKSQRKRTKQQRRNQQIQQLETLQQTKMRQFRKAFRKKQRQFQESLYLLNSRFNYEFPKPPYSLWRMNDDSPIGKTTLTGKIFLFNIAMFALQAYNPQITAMGAKRSDMILEGRQLYRLLTPIFLHGGLGHLMANSYSLKSMGMNVERSFGQSRLVATYLVSGVMGNVFSAVMSPNPAVGASGAIFGLVGAYYTFLSRNGDLFGYAGHMQKSALIETIGFNLVLGMTNPMIDNWGHIGGFVGGVAMAYLIGPKLYVARIPMGSDNMAAGGFGVGKVVVDRPFLTFRTPEFIDEGYFWVNDNLRNLGRRITTGFRGLFNNESQEYFVDKEVNYDKMDSLNNIDNNGDNTIYRTLKEDSIALEGNSVNVSPSDGFRQDVSQLDPVRTARQQRYRRPRKMVPRAGRSLRPRYSNLYR